jgi:2-polyprenyl-6-methoxyphenol hydroxylase-like FAD-dependent oxidoreductase
VDEFVDGLDKADDFYLERMGMVKMNRWSSDKGRVVLLGDSAWCPSAMTGMGTTSSVIGAYILAAKSRKQSLLPPTVSSFETLSEATRILSVRSWSS